MVTLQGMAEQRCSNGVGSNVVVVVELVRKTESGGQNQ